MNTILCTYPRTGSRFFASILRNNTDLEFDESHNYKQCANYKNIITIVRDPLECFISQIVLEIECQNELNKQGTPNNINDNLKGPDGKLDYGKCIGHSKNMFLDFYSNVIRFYNGTVILFEDITNTQLLPEKLKALANKHNFAITNDNIDMSFIDSSPAININKDIFNSSKNSDNYQEVLEYVQSKKHLMTDVSSIYQKMKTFSI